MKFVYPFRFFFFSIQNICFSLMYTNLVLPEYPSDVSAACLLGTFSTEVFRTATAPGSEVLFPLEVLHLARRRLGSAPTSKGLFSRCVENVSRNEPFVRVYSFFFWRFSFRNLRGYLLVIYLNGFWHKTYFNHRTLKGQLQTEYSWNWHGGIWWSGAKIQVSKLSYLTRFHLLWFFILIMHYVLPLVSRCFTLGRWSGAKNMMCFSERNACKKHFSSK